jgi:hypothetical protein
MYRLVPNETLCKAFGGYLETDSIVYRASRICGALDLATALDRQEGNQVASIDRWKYALRRCRPLQPLLRPC